MAMSNRDRVVAEIDSGGEIAETARGPVEFQRRGEPPYILFLHGTPGGHNQGIFAAHFEREGFGTITPSRPGYLRTPIETGPGFDAAADACAALLDTLDIQRVAGYAVSGGGPTGIEFAARHPDRINALILEVAVSGTYAPEVSAAAMAMVSNPFVFWLQGQLLAHFPKVVVSQMVKMESTLSAEDRTRVTKDILANQDKVELLRQLMNGIPPFDLLRAGFENDMSRFAAIERLPLEAVKCPTLVSHGTHDDDVPFAHGETSAREIDGAQLHRVEKGWHLLALGDGADEVRSVQIEFLRKHAGI